MNNLTTEEPPLNNQQLLNKVKVVEPLVKGYASELEKENVRIQKLRVKETAKNKSEQNYLREQIAHLKRELKDRPTITVVIERAEEITHE
jgi:hypothetical protein